MERWGTWKTDRRGGGGHERTLVEGGTKKLNERNKKMRVQN